MNKAKKKCVLTSLANPNLNGLLIGLKWVPGTRQFELDDRYFPCCHAIGTQNVEASVEISPRPGLVARCELRKRIEMVNNIVDLFFSYWPKETQLPQQESMSSEARLLANVSDAVKGYQPQASLLSGHHRTASHLWLMALTCAWRFGLSVHIVNARMVSTISLPMNKLAHGRFAIFIEQMDKMWDSVRAQSISSLVHFAYNSNALLWIEVCKQTDKVGAAQQSTVSDFIKGRISQLKAKSPLEFLDADCQSRIKSMRHHPIDLDHSFHL